MARRTRPFAGFEWMIAWRYLRAKRADGGVSVMTWISLIGITLAVFALIVTLAVRAGFRTELVDTILGANAHVTLLPIERIDADGELVRGFPDDGSAEKALAAVPGVTHVAPLIRGQVMVTDGNVTGGADIYGITLGALKALPRIASGQDSEGDINSFDHGIAMGSGLARQLGVGVGDRVRLVAPTGVKTAMGQTLRQNAYEIVYIFNSGSYEIDRTRIYMPFAEAQSFFNREGLADEIEIMVKDPEQIGKYSQALLNAVPDASIWTWQDSAGSYLRALDMEDNVMFIIMSILVLIASLNIVSGLVMLVKNKGSDIGILRTMGLTEGSVLRIFFICGAFTGVIGTAAGLALGITFALNIDSVMSAINWINGSEVWDPAIRGIYYLPARLQLHDVLSAVGLSLGLSFVVTLFPARRAARMNPVEALRYG